MDEDEPEIHPLDRDYSSPIQSSRRTAQPIGSPVAFHAQLRRIGFTGFAIGFVTVFLSAIVLSNFRGNSTIEGIGSMLHQLGMILILIGGVAVVVAYRLPHITGKVRGAESRLSQNLGKSYVALVGWNIVGFLVIVILTYIFSAFMRPRTFHVLIYSALSIASALMVILIVRATGLLRAYAIGVVLARLLNWFTFQIAIALFGRFSRIDQSVLLLGDLAVVLFIGCACAGLVCLFDSSGSRTTQSAEND